jgi:hypothetical protein
MHNALKQNAGPQAPSTEYLRDKVPAPQTS